MVKGRSFSAIRTPSMVREYLSGEPFPGAQEEDGTPGPQEAIEPGRGDYLASIHRHLKRRIKELNPFYHWPRYHSFVTMMRHLMKLRLVERTGETETSDILVLQGDPDVGTAPGDLRLDPDRGFQQRHYYRLAPGAYADPAWDNPMASIRAIYGIELVARPRVPRPTPVEEEAPARPPGRPRGRRRATPEEAPAPVSEELEELHRQLEERRQSLLERARFATGSEQLAIFQVLDRAVVSFIEVVRPHYTRFPVRDLILDLGTLTGCREAYARAEGGTQMAGALGSCRNGAGLIAADLERPLPVPDILGESVETQEAELEEEEEPEEEEVELTEEEEEAQEAARTEALEQAIEAVTERWKTTEDRINGWARPNSTNAANLLDRFVQETVEAFPDIDNLKKELDSAISDVRQALEEYQEAEPDDREDAWGEFVSGLADVDFSKLGEE